MGGLIQQWVACGPSAPQQFRTTCTGLAHPWVRGHQELWLVNCSGLWDWLRGHGWGECTCPYPAPARFWEHRGGQGKFISSGGL